MYPHQDPYNQSYQPRGQNPWVATGAAAVIAAIIVAVLIGASGDNADGTSPMGAPSMPSMPGGYPGDVPSGYPSGFPSGYPTDGMPTAPGAPSPSASPTNDWNTAAGDRKPFNSAEWFPETGDFSIQKRPYLHLDTDDGACTAAESGLRSMFGADCIGIIRGLWTNTAKTHVGSLSVVSVTDNTAAKSLQNRLSAGQSDGDYVQFITPPANSGVRFSDASPTWVGTYVSGHYMVVIEVALTNGKAIDETAKTMYSDLQLVAIDHINAVTIWGA